MVVSPSALAELKKEIVLRGWNRKVPSRVIFDLSVHLTLLFGGMVGFLMTGNLLLRAVCLCISTLGTVGVAFNAHNSSHCATSGKTWLDSALTYLGLPVICGLSATFWWHKHVLTHHSAPNVIGVDGDADLMPWFAVTAAEIDGSRGFRRFYYQRLQFWIFPFALAMNAFSIHYGGWRFLIGRLRNPRLRRRAHWIDFGALMMYYALFLILPCLLWAPSTVFLLYLLRSILLGYGLYAGIAPSHFPAEALRSPQESQSHANFFALQTMATVNYRPGWLGRFLCSGLDYQIEHHMFPNVSYVHLPDISPAVQQFCREQGLPYRCYGWANVLWKSWMVMRSPQPVVSPTRMVEH